MTLTLEIPDEMVSSVRGQSPSVQRTVMECFAVEAYRTARLSAAQVGELLGFSSRWETQDFLASNGAWPSITATELASEIDHLETLP